MELKALFALLVCGVLIAAPATKINYAKEFKSSKLKLQSITSEINLLERKLNSKNHEFMLSVEKNKKFKKMLNSEEISLAARERELRANIFKIKNLMRKALLSQLDSVDNSDSLIDHKLYLKSLSLKYKESLDLQTLCKSLRKNVENLKAQLIDLDNNQFIVLNLLRDLEKKKQNLSLSYKSERKKKDEFGAQVSKNRILKRIKKNTNPQLAMSAPYSNYSKIAHDKKGITYHFSSEGEIKASYAGTISHVGRVGTYGKVIILDHGKDIRSVYFGALTPRLEKGRKVGPGQIIGYTKLNKTQANSFYFEVRKKDVAQKTIDWIDKKTI